jgi:hypothetical protein
MKLPDMTRQEGVPELRQGVAPVFPAGLKQGAKVVAEVTLQSDGTVADATVISGDAPWADALLKAIGTWRFAAEADAAIVSFRVEADFMPPRKDAPARVDLRLAGLRRSEGVASGPPAGGAPPPASVPAAPATEAARESVPAPPPSPPAASAPAQPPPAPASSMPPAPPASAPPASLPRQPETEVIMAPPPPPPPTTLPTEPGVSAVRDVTLGIGVPDLVSGLRPVVPPLARMAGNVDGLVQAKFAVNAAGATSSLSLEGPELLKPAAEKALASWSFRRTSAERIYLAAAFSYKGGTASASVRLDEPPPPPPAPATP